MRISGRTMVGKKILFFAAAQRRVGKPPSDRKVSVKEVRRPPKIVDLMFNLLPSLYLAGLFTVLSHATAALLFERLPFGWEDLFLFLGVAAVHLLDHLGLNSPEDRQNHPERYRTLRYFQKTVLVICALWMAISSLGILVILPRPWSFVKWSILSTILYGSYSYGIGGWRLKKIKGIKSLAVAAAWLLLMGAFLEGGGLHVQVQEKDFGLTLFSLFFLLVSDTLLLDWLDRVGDRAAGIVSYPPRWDAYLGFGLFAVNLCMGLWFLGTIYGLGPGSTRFVALGAAHLVLAGVALSLKFMGGRGGLYRTFWISLWMPGLWAALLLVPIFGH